MSEPERREQLRMVWPKARLGMPPEVQLPYDYFLRPYQPGDEDRFYQVMDLAGWPGWNEEKLRPWRERLLPDGWMMVIHAESNQMVATAMALRDMGEFGQPGGELGWVASDRADAGKGLGLAVSAAATARMIWHGFQFIHLYSEDERLPALKIYLKMGYVPYLYLPDMPERWKVICAQLNWSYTPEQWSI